MTGKNKDEEIEFLKQERAKLEREVADMKIAESERQKNKAPEQPQEPAGASQQPEQAQVSQLQEMPMVPVNCPHCKQLLNVPSNWSSGQCPNCNGIFVLEEPTAPQQPIAPVQPEKIDPDALQKALDQQYGQQSRQPRQLDVQQQPIQQQPTQQQPQQYGQQQQRQQNQLIEKRVAAMDVLKWLRSHKAMCMTAIAAPFITLVLGMFYLDIPGMIIYAIIAGYVGFVLRKIIIHENYLRQKYGLMPQKGKKGQFPGYAQQQWQGQQPGYQPYRGF
jgi:hypothetical protein